MEPPGAAAVQHQQQQHREKSSLSSRWAVLFLSCVAMAGVYYSLDIPAALHQQLDDYMAPTTKFETRFNLLYTVYALPNTVLPLFGGTLVDKLGAARSLIGFTILAMAGQLLFAIGVGSKSWTAMLVGRTVFGLGGENTCVAGSALLSQWFGAAEVALACAVFLASGRLGSVLNNLISTKVANSSSTPMALWVGVIATASSVIAALSLGIVERREAKKAREQSETAAMLTTLLLDDENSERAGDSRSVRSESAGGDVLSLVPENDGASVCLADLKRFGSLFWLLAALCVVTSNCVFAFNNVASGILLERNYFRLPSTNCVRKFPDQCTLGTLQNVSNPALDKNGNSCAFKNIAPVLPSSLNITTRDVSWEEPQYVFESLSGSDVDCGDSFWADACTKDYCAAQNQATEKAGRVMSIPYILTTALCVPLGPIVDRVGGRASVAALSPIILVAVHASLALGGTSSPMLPLLGQGIAYSIQAAVLWPSISLTVDAKLRGTAYGVVTAGINIGLSLSPLIIAGLYNSNGRHYIPSVEYYFISFALFGLVVAIVLNVVDKKSGGKLNSVATASNEELEPDISSIVMSDEASYRLS